MYAPRVNADSPISVGRVVIRADHDPTAGPVYLVEHTTVRGGRPYRLAILVSERRPWGETAEWLIECMNFVPADELSSAASDDTLESIQSFVSERFPGHGAIGRLAPQSVEAVRAVVRAARMNTTVAFIDRKGQWDDADDPTVNVRNADLVRVRIIHNVVLWARKGRIQMTDPIPLGQPGARGTS